MSKEYNDILKRLEEERASPLKPMKYIIVGCCISIVLLLLNYCVAILMDKPGEFGDMFGVSNALFSGLALAAVAYSIFAQSRELKLQGEATLLSLKELTESVEAQKGSTEAQNKQVLVQEEQVSAIKEQTKAQLKQIEVMYRQIESQNKQSKILLNESLMNIYLEDLKRVQDRNGIGNQLIEDNVKHFSQAVSIKNKRLNRLVSETEKLKKDIDSVYANNPQES